jgi:hypothetical protein
MNRGRTRKTRLGGAFVAATLALALLSAAPAAAHRDHDPQQSGHPLRILAYVVHPVGVILDYVIFRPAHWLGNHEPFQTLFGHKD